MDVSWVNEAKTRYQSLKLAPKPYRYKVGTAALSRLWDRGGGWSKAELIKLAKLPEPVDFLPDVHTIEVDLEDTVHEDERNALLDKKASKTWRALRIASKHDIRLFTAKVGAGDLKTYIDEAAKAGKGEEAVLPTQISDIAQSTHNFAVVGDKRAADDLDDGGGDEKRIKT